MTSFLALMVFSSTGSLFEFDRRFISDFLNGKLNPNYFLALNIIEGQISITSNYSSALTTEFPTFARPGTSTANYHYEAIQVIVFTTDTYTFNSVGSFDTFGYLYNDPFDSSNPSQNLIVQDDQSDGNNQFQMTATLQAGVPYVLVVSMYGPYGVGSYSVTTSGPDNVFYSSITLMEMRTSTTTQSSIITSNYADETTLNSQSYTRSGASGSFYYQAIEVRVPTTGDYTFRTSSSIADTFGYLYQGNFYPSYPQYNIVASDDDGAGGGQFQITTTLRSDLIYYLIFTSYYPGNIGSFTVTVSGPDYVSLNPIHIDNI